MLERYDENFDAEKVIADVMARNQCSRTKATALLRAQIPKEPYYQDRIKKALKKRYKDAFIRKICQGPGAEAGTPDIMFLLEGHYFGFEVKRPILNEVSELQKKTIRDIKKAGGTGAVVTWPEECFRIIDGWTEGSEENGRQKAPG